MSIRLALWWLPRLLYPLTLAVAVVLVALVFLAPALDNRYSWPAGWGRLLALFAHDAAVRQTSVAGAVGLLVTARVFFHRPRPGRSVRRGPPRNVAGA
jgi:hypothetical protein